MKADPKDVLETFKEVLKYHHKLFNRLAKSEQHDKLEENIKSIVYKIGNIGNRPDIRKIQEEQVKELLDLFNKVMKD
jgi:hypothetical protein